MAHDPKYTNTGYPVNLVGHVHNAWKYKVIKYPFSDDINTIVLNVGCDVWRYMPVSLEEVLAEIGKIERGDKDG